MPVGYSGTPLAKKLGLRDGQRVWFSGMPESVADEIGEYALDLTFVADPAEGMDAAHLFVTQRAELERLLAALRERIARDGQVWVSWPKKAAKSADRRHRGHHPRGRAAARLRRHQSLRGRRDLVGPQAGDQ